MEKLIEASINARPSYVLGEPIAITFLFKNTGKDAIYVLPWTTPMDDFLTNCIIVRKGRKRIPYDGILVKHGQPGEEDYIHLEAGGIIERKFDITREFRISEAGDYSVTIDATIPDVVTDNGISPKKQLLDTKNRTYTNSKIENASQDFKVLPGGAPRNTVAENERQKQKAKTSKSKGGKSLKTPPPPAFIGGTTQQQHFTIEAHEKAISSVEVCMKNIDQSPTGSPDYIVWFGKPDIVRFKKVSKHFTDIRHVQLNEEITYNLTGGSCKPSWYAYTYKGSRTIWLCTGFWNTDNSDKFDSRFGTIIHEFSHAVCDTEDLVYSTTACELLAINDPEETIRNADNHEYFAETISMK